MRSLGVDLIQKGVDQAGTGGAGVLCYCGQRWVGECGSKNIVIAGDGHLGWDIQAVLL